MERRHRWLIGVMVLAVLGVSACSQKPPAADASKPAKLESVPGTNLNRVILSAKAAERLGIKTVPVRDEQLQPKKRTVGGEVVVSPAVESADRTRVWVRVPLSGAELRRVARSHPVRVVALGDDEGEKSGTTAQAVKGNADAKEPAALNYELAGTGHGLTPGQRVRVELSLASGEMKRKVVPHAAVIYDAQGKTWVYTNPAPLVFVRHPISVDFVDGDLAVLADGPPLGAAVVAVGAAELLGTEYGKK
jgi:hypothetical protein